MQLALRTLIRGRSRLRLVERRATARPSREQFQPIQPLVTLVIPARYEQQSIAWVRERQARVHEHEPARSVRVAVTATSGSTNGPRNSVIVDEHENSATRMPEASMTRVRQAAPTIVGEDCDGGSRSRNQFALQVRLVVDDNDDLPRRRLLIGHGSQASQRLIEGADCVRADDHGDTGGTGRGQCARGCRGRERIVSISVDEETTRVRVSVGRLVIGLDAVSAAKLSGELDPCPVTRGGGPVDIDISRGSEIAAPLNVERAGDGGDGWISALAIDGLYLMRQSGGMCVVHGRPGELPLRVTTDAALPTWALMREVVRPLLQLGLPARAAGTVHAAAVGRSGAGVLIAGWSESGKTEVALALAERGWSVLADKWTVLDAQGHMAPFPVRAGIRGWVLKYLPQLRSAIPVGTRWRMAAASRAARGIERVADAAASPLTAAALDATRRACAQAERLSVTLSELREMYGLPSMQSAHPPLTLVVVLRTVAHGPPIMQALDTQTALRRLHDSAAYERRDGLGLLLRRRFAGGEDAVLHATATEHQLLATALSNVPLIEISCPFPGDPRLVGDLVEATL